MLCSRCKKNIAVVFITRMEGDKQINEGICIKCAKELGITPVKNLMDKLGMTEDDIESVNHELMETMEDIMEDDDGSTAAFPFVDNLFNGVPEEVKAAYEKDNPKKTKDKKGTVKGKKSRRRFLDGYCINLNKQSKEGKLDRVVGREQELLRVMQILNRRTKNNPCLIGEPGVGKTAVAEALAQKIVEGKVPYRLKNKQIYLLDLTSLVAGTQFRGQFESRIKGLVNEIKEEGNVILFVDEVHNLVAAGDSEGAMNAANILKPALSRGDVQMIGATTLSEYRKYIEKDSALERRFQPVMISEPSEKESLEILKGIKGYYENYHGVQVDNDILKKTVTLSERYITDRYLPDKAIDILDEACSGINLKSTLSAEKNNVTVKIFNIGKQLEGLAEAETYDYKKAADLRSEQCRLEKCLEELEKAELPKLTVNHIAEVIELWTDIPASRISKTEFDRLSGLEDRLKKRIIGQDKAVETISLAIKRNRVGLSPKRKPVSMIFAGPTGVGKTELVKRLASDLFDSPESLIRLDMSEFMEKHSVSRIIGSPPGYVGYDEAGQLTEKIRRKPYSVILFDEIEKAHPEVMNVLLQVLDDGKITDAHGKTVNFENTIIIMTTNAGSQNKEGIVGFEGTIDVLQKEKIEKALSEFLRPEFLNRIDEIVMFSQLTKENFMSICHIMLEDLKKSMDENGVMLSWTDEVVKVLVEKSFGYKFGARELRRSIQRLVENPIANIMIDNYSEHPAGVAITVSDGELRFDTLK